jgi:glycosyltransferase involved in cell wall biosynthesis
MPVYNVYTFIKETIDSVLSPSFCDFELLAIDDGSTAQSTETICSYSDPSIHYHLYPHNFIATLNKGIEMAQEKYIVRMDADDIDEKDIIKLSNVLSDKFYRLIINPVTDCIFSCWYCAQYTKNAGVMKEKTQKINQVCPVFTIYPKSQSTGLPSKHIIKRLNT